MLTAHWDWVKAGSFSADIFVVVHGFAARTAYGTKVAENREFHFIVNGYGGASTKPRAINSQHLRLGFLSKRFLLVDRP